MLVKNKAVQRSNEVQHINVGVTRLQNGFLTLSEIQNEVHQEVWHCHQQHDWLHVEAQNWPTNKHNMITWPLFSISHSDSSKI